MRPVISKIKREKTRKPNGPIINDTKFEDNKKSKITKLFRKTQIVQIIKAVSYQQKT